MKTSMTQKIAIAALLIGTSGYLMADTKGTESKPPGCDRGHNEQQMKGHKKHFMDGELDRKEMFERKLNSDDIRTLTKAKLIMQGNENLKVGDVSKTKTGYDVTIVTNDDSLVKTLAIADNGMPLKKYKHIEERMKNRSKSK